MLFIQRLNVLTVSKKTKIFFRSLENEKFSLAQKPNSARKKNLKKKNIILNIPLGNP